MENGSKYLMRCRDLFEDIDLSQSARLERARAMGFDTSKVYYTGTPFGDIEEFDPHRTADEDLAYGQGIYVTADAEAASGYARPGASWGNTTKEPMPTVYPVFIRAKNPFDLDKVYPWLEVQRLLEHIADESQLYQECAEDAADDIPSDELQELEMRLDELQNADSADDIDPNDYEEGENDPDYKNDVQYSIDIDIKSVKRQIDFLERRMASDRADHDRAVAMGRRGSASGRAIYRELWTHTDEYHDWRAERQLFGGDSQSFAFKSDANEFLEEKGYDALTHVDSYNPGRKGHTHNVVILFHSWQVRSIHARFNPKKSRSGKLMDSATPRR